MKKVGSQKELTVKEERGDVIGQSQRGDMMTVTELVTRLSQIAGKMTVTKR